MTFELPALQDQKLLTLHCRSVSWWGNEHILHCFDWKGSQYVVYELLPDIAIQITQVA